MQNDSMLGHGDVAMGEAPQPHPQPQASGGKTNLVVDARGTNGEHAPSSWPLLLPLLGEQPRSVAPGASLTVSLGVELLDVEAPPRYSLEAVVAEPEEEPDMPLSELDATPSFELLHRLAAPLKRLRLKGEIAKADAASEAAATKEERAALRRRAWFRYRGKRRPPVVKRVTLRSTFSTSIPTC